MGNMFIVFKAYYWIEIPSKKFKYLVPKHSTVYK